MGKQSSKSPAAADSSDELVRRALPGHAGGLGGIRRPPPIGHHVAAIAKMSLLAGPAAHEHDARLLTKGSVLLLAGDSRRSDAQFATHGQDDDLRERGPRRVGQEDQPLRGWSCAALGGGGAGR